MTILVGPVGQRGTPGVKGHRGTRGDPGYSLEEFETMKALQERSSYITMYLMSELTRAEFIVFRAENVYKLEKYSNPRIEIPKLQEYLENVRKYIEKHHEVCSFDLQMRGFL